jgi:N-methylhydantoinase B
VLEEVRDGLISLAAAKEQYGVVIDPETMELRQEETRRLRARMGKEF